jgi:hypothetical protein
MVSDPQLVAVMANYYSSRDYPFATNVEDYSTSESSYEDQRSARVLRMMHQGQSHSVGVLNSPTTI